MATDRARQLLCRLAASPRVWRGSLTSSADDGSALLELREEAKMTTNRY